MPAASKNRRQFLRLAGQGLMVSAAASRWQGVLWANPLGFPIGTQLGTQPNQPPAPNDPYPGWLGPDCHKDLDGTLEKLAAIGYKQVETGSFFGRTPAEFRHILDANGLKCPSAHMPPKTDKSEWEEQVEGARQVGLRYLVVDEEPDSLDEYKRVAERWNKLGEQCKQAGLQLAVHNHHHCFQSFDGVTGYDVLMKETDPKLVTFELDCFWAVWTEHDPVKLFHQYPGRFSLLHIKDLKAGYKPLGDRFALQPMTEVGRGVIDWKRIFAAAPQAGVKHYFVEQDHCDRPPLESARISYEYLKGLKA